MRKIVLQVEGMEGAESESSIIRRLKTLEGVFLVHIDRKNAEGVITFDENKIQAFEIAKAIEVLGYGVKAKFMPVQKASDKPVAYLGKLWKKLFG